MSETLHGYHQQPYTLDPTKDAAEADAPQAMGHLSWPDDSLADGVREAHEQLKETVEAETKAADEAAEKGEAAPGDLPTPIQARNAEADDERPKPKPKAR